MSKPKLTPWFDGRHHKPLTDRPGPYRRQYKHFAGNLYCKWDGTNWFMPAPTPEMAMGATKVSIQPDLPWRGVAK